MSLAGNYADGAEAHRGLELPLRNVPERHAMLAEEARANWKRLDDECAARGVYWDGRMLVLLADAP